MAVTNVTLLPTMSSASDYQPPVLTVDLVAFRVAASQLEVLLLQRAAEPFAGEWALPGGYNFKGETTIEALTRVAYDKVGLDVAKDLGFLEQLYTFDTVARDPRGHAVSVVYLGCGSNFALHNGNHQHQFWRVDELPNLAFDHADIIRYARDRLNSKMSYSNAVAGLLPAAFTLSQLQTAYEAVRARRLDKRNFRKKFLSLNTIHETGGVWREGAHRPAKLYAFNSKALQVFNAPF